MNEQFDPRAQSRVQALYIYTIALEQGDFDTVAKVLRVAEQDVALERMILDLHSASLEGISSAQGDNVSSLYALLRAYPHMAVGAEKAGLNGTTPANKNAPRKNKKSSRLSAILQGLAAVLVVGALLSGFALVLAHHGPSGKNGQGQPAVNMNPFIVTIVDGIGTVYALQAKDGAIVWHYATQQEVDMMVQQGEYLYVATSANNETRPDSLYKFRTSDDTLLWKKTYPPLTGFSTIAVDDDAVAISGGEGDGSMDVVSSKDGSVLWHFLSGTSTWADPIIAEQNHVVYVRWKGEMKAFQLTSGKLLWTATGFTAPTNIIFDVDTLYAYDDFKNTITVLDRESGRSLRVIHLPPGEYPLQGGYNSNLLYLGKGMVGQASPASICALRLLDGAQLWCTKQVPKTAFQVPPAVASDAFYYIQVTQDNHWQVLSLRASDGAPRWHWDSPNGNTVSLMNDLSIVATQNIVFVTTPHGFFALSASDGQVLWHALVGKGPALFALPSVPGQTYQLPN